VDPALRSRTAVRVFELMFRGVAVENDIELQELRGIVDGFADEIAEIKDMVDGSGGYG
jgi:hypothetical protein